MLSSTNVTHNIIVIEWEVTNNLICGDTSINVVTSPSHQNIDVDVDENNDMVTISNLENGTMYTITVTATNRAGSVTRMITATTLGGSTTSMWIQLNNIYALYRSTVPLKHNVALARTA